MSHLYYSPPPSHYVHNSYYTPSAPSHLTHVVAPPGQRIDATQQRKRPKYTRSKTGCLTCRQKKIKCDESKPKCQRCSHGQRECTWPEGVPTRKKAGSRRDQKNSQDALQSSESPVLETRPSTATSSVSETSTPPTRDNTPPKREPAEQGLPPLVSRRHTDTSVALTSVASDTDASRRQQPSHGYPAPSSSNTHGLPGIPDVANSYPQHASYHQYPSSSHYTHAPHHPQSLVLPRVTSQHEVMRSAAAAPDTSAQWSSSGSMVSPHVESPEQQHYYSNAQERNMVGHASHQVRY